MADAAPAPQSPLWWLNKLERELYARQADMAKMDSYYRGDHPLPFLTKAHESKYRDEFRKLLEDCRANFMRLVVDAIEERLRVEGFRLSPETDATADSPSWKIWQANSMDANSQTAFVESLVKGLSYLSVWGATEKNGLPTIAVEDATQTIVGYVPGSNYRKRAAAVKIWTDDWTSKKRANVYMPDGIYKYEAPVDPEANTESSSYIDRPTTSTNTKWVPIENTTTTPQFVKNPTGVVPIIPLRNRPRLLCEGESDLSDLFRIQNQINATLFLRALASYFSAHKQRWMVGGEIMKDDSGKDVEPFNVAVDTLFHDENPDVKFGEFSQTDLSGYSDAIKQMVDFIAITARVPRHYLEQSGQAPSGDAIKSAESGLVKKVERKQRDFGEALEEAMGLALQFAGGEEPPVDSEIVWADAQTESAGVITDAVIKQYAEGLVPWEAALEKLGYTQTEIQRYSNMRASDALLRDVNLPAKNEGPVVVA